MGCIIMPCCFAPKFLSAYKKSNDNIHCISYSACNFNCDFCFVSSREEEVTYTNYSAADFSDRITELIKLGQSFKFTGGEPTIDPHFLRDVRIVKEHGGTIYLDTNGSNYRIIEKAINENLIDYLGISLKGLSVEEALAASNIKNPKLCWDNVFNTLKLASLNKHIQIIVTYVCDNTFSEEKLKAFANLIKPYNAILKINNYICGDNSNSHKKPIAPENLKSIVEEFLCCHEEWHGRIVLINNYDAVRNASAIKFH